MTVRNTVSDRQTDSDHMCCQTGQTVTVTERGQTESRWQCSVCGELYESRTVIAQIEFYGDEASI